MPQASAEQQPQRLRIGIIGAGFSGTALAATLQRCTEQPLEIYLFDRTNRFGMGEAYSTPYPFHLLNVRAQDMSAFEDLPDHFVNWLQSIPDADTYLDQAKTVTEQFVPRVLYGRYLKQLLNDLQTDSRMMIKLIQAEIMDILPQTHGATLILKQADNIMVDKIVLAVGNGTPAALPFPVDMPPSQMINAWHYRDLEKINAPDPVLIVGTGLSMIDAVLTLHQQQHQGKIYAVSRHGLLPLPHVEANTTCEIEKHHLPKRLLHLSKHVRTLIDHHAETGGDWQAVMNGLRKHVSFLWQSINTADKKRFLRHAMAYWNIHRHRVHHQLAQLMTALIANQQLQVLPGRVQRIKQGYVDVKLRHLQQVKQFEIKWMINCIGPSLNMSIGQSALLQSLMKRGLISLDALNLGLSTVETGAVKDAEGNLSSLLYALGPPTKGTCWETTAVPDIRKQCLTLAKYLLTQR